MKNSISITRTVWALGMISLLTDMASEMLYPIMPLYLEQIGFSMLSIGILEGVAEAVAGLSKAWFGAWSDKSRQRTPFVRWGYGLSALAKPLIAFWPFSAWVFGMRTLDRLGKGIRTAARDALLAQEATPGAKARIFGFHRGMDTLGAAIGPLIALVFLQFFPTDYKALFLWAFLPGLAAIVASGFLREKPMPEPSLSKPRHIGFWYFPKDNVPYRRLVIGLLLFALINSSDFFLLLALKSKGLNDSVIILLYIFYNLVYAGMSWPAGVLADRFGLQKIFSAGLLCFAIAYAGMTVAGGIWWFLLLFLIYGAYAACTDGVAKAWITQVADKAHLGYAIGAFEGAKSIAALLASSLAGLIWMLWGAPVLFGFSAVGALALVVYFWRLSGGAPSSGL